MSGASSVLITGAHGYLGRLFTRALAEDRRGVGTIVATDVRPVPPGEQVDGVEHRVLDVRDGAALSALIEAHAVDAVVHLAAMVTPRPGDTRELQYAVDVEGTGNVLDACAARGVRKLVYTSSGAAYGYSAQNAALIFEDHPLRGNREFAYAWHKRLVEDLLAEHRAAHPEVGQLVFRVSTILGASVKNQITALFERRLVLGLRGVDTPFCFIWDQDVVRCLVEGVHGDATGTYNLTGDGVMTLREIARAMGRPFVGLPEPVLRRALGALERWTHVGPEQLLFLRYRPVLANEKLKSELGYVPRKSSRQVFDHYRGARA